MATLLRIHTKSKSEYLITLGPEAADMTPEEATSKFYKGIDFNNTTTLRLDRFIFKMEDIECFEFE